MRSLAEDTIYPSPIEIYAIRQSLGMTQPEFASMLGVSRQTVKYWENGTYAPRREYAEQMWDALAEFRERAEEVRTRAEEQTNGQAIFPNHPIGSPERREVSAIAVYIMSTDPTVQILIEGQVVPNKELSDD